MLSTSVLSDLNYIVVANLFYYYLFIFYFCSFCCEQIILSCLKPIYAQFCTTNDQLKQLYINNYIPWILFLKIGFYFLYTLLWKNSLQQLAMHNYYIHSQKSHCFQRAMLLPHTSLPSLSFNKTRLTFSPESVFSF